MLKILEVYSESGKFVLRGTRIKERVYTDLTLDIRDTEEKSIAYWDNSNFLINTFYPLLKTDKAEYMGYGKEFINSEDYPELKELFNEAFSLGMFEDNE